MKTIFIVGATGGMASYLTESLNKFQGEQLKVVLGGRNAEALEKIANINMIATELAGNNHQFVTEVCDLSTPKASERLADQLITHNPDVVMNCTRAVSGVKYGQISIPNDLGYGCWLPFAMELSYVVAKAVGISGIKGELINSSYSDAVCPVLAQMDDCRTPISGIGNVFHMVPRLKHAVKTLDGGFYKNKDVEVFFSTSHHANTYISREGDPRGSETALEVYCDGVISHLSKERVFKAAMIPVAEGAKRNLMAASSSYRTIMEVLFPSGNVFHAPGVGGLVGGYPVTASIAIDGSTQFNPGMPNTNLAELIRINQQSLAMDGVLKVNKKFTQFCPENAEKLRKLIGYAPDTMPHDIESIREIAAKMLSGLKDAGLVK